MVFFRSLKELCNSYYLITSFPALKGGLTPKRFMGLKRGIMNGLDSLLPSYTSFANQG